MRLSFVVAIIVSFISAERVSSAPCEAAALPSTASVSPASQARKIMAMGARANWTLSDYNEASLAILPDGRQAWGQLARVLWEGSYGRQALTIRTFSFSEAGKNASFPGLFLQGSKFLNEFVTSIEDLVRFVLAAYADRRAWPDDFLDQLWAMAYDYIDESTYISTAAGGLRDALAVNPNLDRFLKPFVGELHNVSTIRFAAERSGMTIMETLLNLEINSDSQTLKVEPGNLNILPIASEPAKAQLAVGILSTIETLKARYRRSKLKFVTYTDERALPIYLALGFQKMRIDDFKRLPKNSFELDPEGFVHLSKRFKNGAVVNWTPLICDESEIRSSAFKFIEDFRQKYPNPDLKRDLDQLVNSITLTLKSPPLSTRSVTRNSLDDRSYESTIQNLPLGFHTKKGFRGLPQLPVLAEGEVFRTEIAENGQRRVGEFWLNNGVLEYRVDPFYPFEAHDWKVSRRGQALPDEPTSPLWRIRVGGLTRDGSLPSANWMEYKEYENGSAQPSFMETTWVENFKAVRIAGDPRLASLVAHRKAVPKSK